MMIDLNPLVIDRHCISAPTQGDEGETDGQWYGITDRISYIPWLWTSSVQYSSYFQNLPNGLRTHVVAPLGLDMRGEWTLEGEVADITLREVVVMNCAAILVPLVRTNIRRSHQTLVDALIENAGRSSFEGKDRSTET